MPLMKYWLWGVCRSFGSCTYGEEGGGGVGMDVSIDDK